MPGGRLLVAQVDRASLTPLHVQAAGELFVHDLDLDIIPIYRCEQNFCAGEELSLLDGLAPTVGSDEERARYDLAARVHDGDELEVLERILAEHDLALRPGLVGLQLDLLRGDEALERIAAPRERLGVELERGALDPLFAARGLLADLVAS